jgi:DDE superfamily endonuclease
VSRTISWPRCGVNMIFNRIVRGHSSSRPTLEFEEKVVDVVGLYLDPPMDAVVLSIDEKTQIQALDRTQPLLPLTFSKTEKRTHDYSRHGTTNLFAALNTATGDIVGQCFSRRRTKEFITFMDQVVKVYEERQPNSKQLFITRHLEKPNGAHNYQSE